MEYGKKIFKIEYKSDEVRFIRFHLNSVICYSGSENDYSQYIKFAKSYPFDTWEAGDYLEIDLDRIRCGVRNGEIIGDSSIARILDWKVMQEINKSQVKLYKLEKAKEKLAPMLNSFSQKIINKDFFFSLLNNGEFVFDENSSLTWKKQLDYMINEFDRKEQKANDWRNKYNNLSSEVNRLEDECRDLRNKKKEKEDKLKEEVRELKQKLEQEQKGRQNDKIKHDNEKLTWARTEGEKNSRIAKLEEKIESGNAREVELKKRLSDTEKDRDNQVGKLEIKLDQRKVEIRALENQLTNLQLKDEKKENELKKKNEEIERLRRWAGLSREELLTEKIRLKYGKLEIFANQIGINLQQVNDLCRYCERLVHAQKNFNQANIETHENNIARVREGLRQRGLQIPDIQKFCHKCEKVAKMRVELNEIRQQQGQYEARQEVPPLNNDNRLN